MNFTEKARQISEALVDSGCAFGQGVDDADDEAQWIIYAGLGLDIASEIEQGIDRSSQKLKSGEISAINRLLDERITTRRPLAYILNETWFCGNRFYIDERTIIPRSYLAEWIPDQFQPWIDPGKTRNILDLCTGSGCIAVSCALAFPEAMVMASDISEDALEVAAKNIELFDLEYQVSINQGDRFQGVDDRFDLIVCNPPYVSDDRMAQLPGEFRDEPELAFRGGSGGLDFIIPMLREAASHLTKSGFMVVEAGSASQALEQNYPEIPFTWLSTEHDEMVVFIISAGELERFQHIL
jgi:ribosomal protein L3 glutamine methyltransferase